MRVCNTIIMEDFISNIIDFLLPANNIILYLFLFVSAIVENLFPPIPGDTITAFGAFLVGTGRLSYFFVYVSTTTGSVIGFMLLFAVGKKLGKAFFMEKDYRLFPGDRIEAAERWFVRYGYMVVLANRFLPGIRSVISVVSGISRLKTVRVFLLSLASASIWNLIWIHIGYLLGDNWDVVKEKIGEIMRGYNIAVSIIIGLALVVFIYLKRKRKRKRSEHDRES